MYPKSFDLIFQITVQNSSRLIILFSYSRNSSCKITSISNKLTSRLVLNEDPTIPVLPVSSSCRHISCHHCYRSPPCRRGFAFFFAPSAFVGIPRYALQRCSGHCAQEEWFDATQYGVERRGWEIQRVEEHPPSRYQDLSDPPTSENWERVELHYPGGESAIIFGVGYIW